MIGLLDFLSRRGILILIFKIDKSCLNPLDNNDEVAINVLNILANNRRLCRNYIFAEKEVLEKLKNNNYLSKTTQAVFELLFNKSSECRLYFESVNKYINIVESIDDEENRVEKMNDKEECKITLRELNKNCMTDLTVLILENQEDYELYELIAKYYVNSKNINASFNFDPKPGGGSTIVKVLENVVEVNKNFDSNKKLCLCIVDSDIKYYTGVCGETRKQVEKFIKNRKQDFWKVKLLDVHEIENLLPISWLEEYNKKNNLKREDTINFLNYIILQDINKDFKAIYFFDIKEGLKKDKFICSNSENNRDFIKFEEYRKFWNEYLKGFRKELSTVEGENIINGLGKNILLKVTEYFKTQRFSMELDKRNNYLNEKWSSIGIDIFSWGCVGKKIL